MLANQAAESSTKRALRRHHRSRMIERARAVVRSWQMPFDDWERRAVRLHDHLAACSCSMCGNPRKHIGKRTRQEIMKAELPVRGGRGRVEDCD